MIKTPKFFPDRRAAIDAELADEPWEDLNDGFAELDAHIDEIEAADDCAGGK